MNSANREMYGGASTSRAYPPSTANNPETNQPVSNHDELIKYINDNWLKVIHENGKDAYYKNDKDTHHLKDFIPFDLEVFWGKKVIQKIKIQQ